MTLALTISTDCLSVRIGRYECRAYLAFYWNEGKWAKFRGLEISILDHLCKPQWVRFTKTLFA